MKKSKFKTLSIFLCILVISFLVIGVNEYLEFIKWYGMLLVLGIISFPISLKLFKNFKNGGYIFSKTIGLAISRIYNVANVYTTYIKVQHPKFLFLCDNCCNNIKWHIL